jgi:molybdenum cofactor cytidylyltransferase
MGHRPKCLLQLDGISLIQRQISALTVAGVHELVVVLGHYRDDITLALQAFPLRKFRITVVQNPQPDAGQTSSLKLGLQALPTHIDTVLIALADQPLIEPQDISDLIAAYHLRPECVQVVQPHVNGQPGNPVMFTALVREAILAGNPDFGCKQWQATHPQAVLRWATPNPHYCTDVDSEQDILALAQRTGHLLLWPT